MYIYWKFISIDHPRSAKISWHMNFHRRGPPLKCLKIHQGRRIGMDGLKGQALVIVHNSSIWKNGHCHLMILMILVVTICCIYNNIVCVFDVFAVYHMIICQHYVSPKKLIPSPSWAWHFAGATLSHVPDPTWRSKHPMTATDCNQLLNSFFNLQNSSCEPKNLAQTNPEKHSVSLKTASPKMLGS